MRPTAVLLSLPYEQAEDEVADEAMPLGTRDTRLDYAFDLIQEMPTLSGHGLF